MGIALFTSNPFFAPLQAAFGWFAGPAPSRPAKSTALRSCAPAPRLARRPCEPSLPTVRRLSAGPVRVLRVVDAQSPSAGGHLRISGRMADVCAELDRLAALESSAGRHLRVPGALPRA